MDLQSHYRLSDLCRGEAGVDLGACDGFMAEEGGDGVYVHSVFQEVHREGVEKQRKVICFSIFVGLWNVSVQNHFPMQKV